MKETPANSGHAPKWIGMLGTACLLLVLLGLLLPRPKPGANAPSPVDSANATNQGATANSSHDRPARKPRYDSGFGPARTAQEIVADKVAQFGRSRREIVRAIGRRLGKNVPPEIEKFFEAVEAGDWEQIDALWKVMAKHSGQFEKKDGDSAHWPDFDPFWPAVLDAYGVAEQAHLWPAQKLLNYGNAILDSLRPGMIYVGGTDDGRWIPELLNETSGGEPHIIVTQNAFADGRYLEFMNELYGAQMQALTKEDSQRAFQDYITDATKRLQHDQQFPDEPKQLRPGEAVHMVDGKAQVSGQVAVMAINERLLQALMDKNPDVGFAIQQSFPFESMYANTTPLGPIMELRVSDAQNEFTRERATQTVDYWRSTANERDADSSTLEDFNVRKAYAKLISEQAALLLSHKYSDEAEQAFQIANAISPASPETIFRYTNLLMSQNRTADALRVVENGVKAAPDNTQFRDLAERLRAMKK